jgi:pSer/pThr/pTyr-binding forkhead associated (FHA) protein
MAKLILSLEGQVINEYPLNKERVTIGRKAENDVAIDNLAISSKHAVIITILNDSFMEDLGSTNGTLVNGANVKRHFLQDGDVIEIGKHKLKYVNEVQSTTTAEEFEKTMVLRRPAAEPVAPQAVVAERAMSDTHVGARSTVTSRTAVGSSVAAPVAAPPAPAATQGVGTVQVLNGQNAGKTLELTKSLTTLGKPGVQVAVITKRPNGYFITHVEGASFPVVNGTSVGAQAAALKENDVIEIAGVKMEFFYKH